MSQAKPLCAVALAALALLAVTPCLAQPWDPSALIVWLDDRHQEALFVPQSMLPQQSTALGGTLDRSAIPMRSSPLRSLELYVDRVQKQRLKGFPGECIEWGLDSYPDDPERQRISLVDVASRYPATFTGRVRAVEVGLIDAGSIVVGSRVDVEVQEVVRDTSGRLSPGRVVNFFQAGGSVEVAGIRLCMDPRGAIDFKIGDTALIVAVPNPNDANNWVSGVKLLVEQGVVNSRQGFQLIQERELTIDQLQVLISNSALGALQP